MARRYDDDRDHTTNGHAAHAKYWDAINYESTLGYPVRKAYTLEELAEKIGCDPRDFVETINAYNQEMDNYDGPTVCKPGMMGKFSKHKVLEPPFYAITLLRFNESASGGVMIDEELRVRNNHDGYIPGLYAVGDSASGIFCNQKYGGGSIGELNWAMASGYLAGGAAADYVRAL
jgi:fumarate reductase flavoprotein subunit